MCLMIWIGLVLLNGILLWLISWLMFVGFLFVRIFLMICLCVDGLLLWFINLVIGFCVVYDIRLWFLVLLIFCSVWLWIGDENLLDWVIWDSILNSCNLLEVVVD